MSSCRRHVEPKALPPELPSVNMPGPSVSPAMPAADEISEDVASSRNEPQASARPASSPLTMLHLKRRRELVQDHAKGLGPRQEKLGELFKSMEQNEQADS